MDCLEFRRRLGVDPRVEDGQARDHVATCEGCFAAAVEARAFETRLARVLAIEPPADLIIQILATQRAEKVEAFPPRRRLGWIALAAAASVLVAFGVVRLRNADSLPDLVARHVTAPDERDALAMRTPVPASDVMRAFADRGVVLAEEPPQVVYVSECPVGRWRSVHMVSAGDEGPVSVLYIAKDRAAAARDFRRDGLVGRVVPMADGTLFMLAPTDRRFGVLERAWRTTIEGPPRAIGRD
jgi:hypothetical protein